MTVKMSAAAIVLHRAKKRPDSFFKPLLRGNCTPNWKLACFVLYPKIINTFLKNNNNICILLSKKIKNSIKI